jgi:hypothetical protein
MVSTFIPQTDSPEWREAFPEPRTLPCGWDLSELPHYRPPLDSQPEVVTAAVPDWSADPSSAWHPDPFPAVRTFPDGWDLTDVLAAERERMNEKSGLFEGGAVSDGQFLDLLMPLSLDTASVES